MSSISAEWPWYEVVEGETLDQGDIISNCPVVGLAEVDGIESEDYQLMDTTVSLLTTDVIIMTQTCDLANSKATDIILCPVWSISSFVTSEPEFRKNILETATNARLAIPKSGEPDFDKLVWKIICQSKSIKKNLDSITKGERSAYVMLPQYQGPPTFPQSLVTFHQIYTQPRISLEKIAGKRGKRIRLRPPYREYVSQAFGRYFMRIGLPVDVPRLA